MIHCCPDIISLNDSLLDVRPNHLAHRDPMPVRTVAGLDSVSRRVCLLRFPVPDLRLGDVKGARVCRHPQVPDLGLQRLHVELHCNVLLLKLIVLGLCHLQLFLALCKPQICDFQLRTQGAGQLIAGLARRGRGNFRRRARCRRRARRRRGR